jgi:hypothetical protein
MSAAAYPVTLLDPVAAGHAPAHLDEDGMVAVLTGGQD